MTSETEQPKRRKPVEVDKTNKVSICVNESQLHFEQTNESVHLLDVEDFEILSTKSKGMLIGAAFAAFYGIPSVISDPSGLWWQRMNAIIFFGLIALGLGGFAFKSKLTIKTKDRDFELNFIGPWASKDARKAKSLISACRAGARVKEQESTSTD